MNDLSGQRFGRLTVLRDSGKRYRKNTIWNCLCDCGNTAKVYTSSLKRGHTKSCGCLQREFAIENGRARYKHGGVKTRLYNIWVCMKKRCNNVNSPDYKYYGAKGIKVCTEWQNNYAEFSFWAGLNGYQNNLTIDRIDHHGNYEPLNCQWLTNSENTKKRWANK
jgi:hypothetical protein